MILGVDPGLSGAFALLDSSASWYITLLRDMPVMSKTYGKGKQVDAHGVELIVNACVRLCASRGDDLLARVEQVSAMPKQGVSSVFSFGDSFGVVRAILTAHEVPIEYVLPRAWKQAHGLLGKDKDASRTLVMQRWPSHAKSFSRKCDVDRADAVLIAASAKR